MTLLIYLKGILLFVSCLATCEGANVLLRFLVTTIHRVIENRILIVQEKLLFLPCLSLNTFHPIVSSIYLRFFVDKKIAPLYRKHSVTTSDSNTFMLLPNLPLSV